MKKAILKSVNFHDILPKWDNNLSTNPMQEHRKNLAETLHIGILSDFIMSFSVTVNARLLVKLVGKSEGASIQLRLN